MAESTLNEWTEWWVAGALDERASGELSFDPATGVSLTLHGPLSGLHASRFRAPTLHGENFDGTWFTLPQAAIMQAATHMGAGGARVRTRLSGTTLLRGCHADDPENLAIDRAVVRFTGLRELCDRPWPPEESTFLRDTGLGVLRRLELESGVLMFSQQTQRQQGRFTESSERDVAVLIHPAERLTLEDLGERWLRPLEGVVLFAARAPVLLKSVTLLLVEPAGAEDLHETQVEVHTESPSLAREPPEHYDRPLVPFNALGDQAQEFFACWWKLYEELGKAANFLIGALGSRIFLENKLLTLMSVVESYHRARHDEPTVPLDEHGLNVTNMLEVVENDAQREHYRTRLRFAGEQTARQRLKALVRRAHEALPGVDRLDADLADALVNTRNDLTHLDAAGPRGLTGVDLAYAVARLELVIQANLLLDLHLNSEKVEQLVMTSYWNQMPVRDFSAEDEPD